MGCFAWLQGLIREVIIQHRHIRPDKTPSRHAQSLMGFVEEYQVQLRFAQPSEDATGSFQVSSGFTALHIHPVNTKSAHGTSTYPAIVSNPISYTMEPANHATQLQSPAWTTSLYQEQPQDRTNLLGVLENNASFVQRQLPKIRQVGLPITERCNPWNYQVSPTQFRPTLHNLDGRLLLQQDVEFMDKCSGSLSVHHRGNPYEHSGFGGTNCIFEHRTGTQLLGTWRIRWELDEDLHTSAVDLGEAAVES